MPVYFIHAGEGGPVKIGTAENPESRLLDLQCGNHEELRIIRLLPGGLLEERWLHEQFCEHRVRGEWFRFVPAMETIEPLQSPPTGGSARVIEKCGGPEAVAALAGVHVGRVYRWTYPRERGGTGGLIPTRHQTALLEKARDKGIDLTPADFFPSEAA